MNNKTIQQHCKALEELEFITITKIKAEESSTGKPSIKVKITSQGLKWISKF